MGDRSSSARGTSALAALAGVALALLHQGTFFFPLLGPRGETLGALAEVEGLIEERWVEAPITSALRDGALRGMVSQLDPFSEYVPPTDLQAFEEHTTGQFGGLGIYLELREGQVVVITPLEDTPAWRAGVLPGDVILAIDGVAAAFQTASEAVEKLKGPVGTSVVLTVLHAADQRQETLTLERAVIQVRTVKSERVLDEGIGYLRVTAFNAGTVNELDQGLARLHPEGLKALILDLRENPGGYLKGAVEVADRFLPAGKVVVTTRSRGDVLEQELETEQPAVVTIPLAVLIDGGTASAAEILTGALQDQGVATVVGVRSYGKGSVQSLLDLQGGKAQLKLTTQYFFTPNGRRIHKGSKADDDPSWGIAPDIEVAIDAAARRQVAIREAELDIARIGARREGRPHVGEERLHRDDPQVAAAFAHLQQVLAGAEKIGQRRVITPAPADAARVDSRATAAVPPQEKPPQPPPEQPPPR